MGKQGYKAKEVALRYGAKYATTEYEEILQDEQIDLVFITTRHDLHAPLATRAARAGNPRARSAKLRVAMKISES